MSNPNKARGTRYENVVLARLRRVYGSAVTRSAAGTESNDFSGLDYPHECKKRKTLAIPEWVRRIRRVSSTPNRWVLWISDGDNRRAGSFGDIAVIDADYLEDLLYIEEKTKDVWFDDSRRV